MEELMLKSVAFSVVHFSVLDDNDYAPLFLFPSMNCIVSENLPSFFLYALSLPWILIKAPMDISPTPSSLHIWLSVKLLEIMTCFSLTL